MYSIISSKEYYGQIKEALGGADVLIEKVGSFDEAEIENVVQEVSRVFTSVLLLDITCHPGPTLISAIRKFRIARPHTRIIVIAPGFEPGDRTIAGLVSKAGVYDIVATAPFDDNDFDDDEDYDPEEIRLHNITDLVKSALSRPQAVFADAVRWDIFDEFTLRDKKAKNRDGERNDRLLSINKERYVIEKLLGTVTVAVAGVSHGVGTTHTAIAIAQFLGRRFSNVAIVELNDSNHFSTLNNPEYKRGKLPGSFVINRVDFYPYKSHDLLEIIQAEYKYLVFDIGLIKNIKNKYISKVDIKAGSIIDYTNIEPTNDCIVEKSEYFSELARANCRVVCTGLMEWQINSLTKVFSKDEDFSRWNFYITNSDEAMLRDFKKETGFRNIFLAPYAPDPFLAYKEQDEVITNLLRDILPAEKVVKSNIFSNIFKRDS